MTLSNLDLILARRTTILMQLANLSTCQLGGRPDSTEGGFPNERKLGHVAFRLSLYRELQEITGLLSSLGGPWEVIS